MNACYRATSALFFLFKSTHNFDPPKCHACTCTIIYVQLLLKQNKGNIFVTRECVYSTVCDGLPPKKVGQPGQQLTEQLTCRNSIQKCVCEYTCVFSVGFLVE